MKTWGLLLHTGTPEVMIQSRKDDIEASTLFIAATHSSYFFFLKGVWNIFTQPKVNSSPDETEREGWRFDSLFSVLSAFGLWGWAHLEFLDFHLGLKFKTVKLVFPSFGVKPLLVWGASRYQLLPYQLGTELHQEFESMSITLQVLYAFSCNSHN